MSKNGKICTNKTNTKTISESDTDFYFTDAAINLAIQLVQKLMSDYKISIG